VRSTGWKRSASKNSCPKEGSRWIDRGEARGHKDKEREGGERERERERGRGNREKESNGRLSGAKWSEVEWRSWRPVISAGFMLFRVFASGSAAEQGVADEGRGGGEGERGRGEEEMATASQYKYA